MTPFPQPDGAAEESAQSIDPAAAAGSPRLQRKRVRLAEVARAARVSSMTVSRVVNGTGSVSPETREYVQSVIRKLGYMPHAAARSLAMARRERIALLHDDTRTASLSKLLIGVLQESNRHGAQLLVRRLEPRDPSGWRSVTRLVDDRIVAVILAPPLGDEVHLVDALRGAGIAVVAVSSGAACEEAMHVGIDERRAAREMTQHLLALGHRRIGFIRGPASWSAGEQRWSGFCAALREAGIATDRIPIAQAECTFRAGIEAAKELLEEKPAPTAIFASCDNMAAAAVAVAHRQGLQVPDDLTVVGFDDDLAACAIWPELTTIRQPISEMAVEAVRLLIAAIRSRCPESHANRRKKVVGHDLILRASASAPASPPSCALLSAQASVPA